jgi:acetate kinase
MRVLVLNAGSSSLKVALVDAPAGADLGALEVERGADASRRDDTADALRAAIRDLDAGRIDAVGHRVVHGGGRHRAALVDGDLLAEIEALDALAPLHNRVAVDVARAARAAVADVPHVAVFDTAFHATIPAAARTYALPGEWVDRLGIRRYGFHGLSVRWALERAGVMLGRDATELELVVAHLGSGASVTAVADGRSVATSMGMTPLEGLVMGTRSGSVDPGILLALLRDGVSIDELTDGLAHRSGLAALGGTADVRLLSAAAGRGETDAILALEIFATRAAAEIAAAATALRRVDAIAFTGGIGFGSAAVRAAIVRRLAVIGVDPLPLTADHGPRSDDDVLSARSSPRPAVLAIRAREERIIARDVHEVVVGAR